MKAAVHPVSSPVSHAGREPIAVLDLFAEITAGLTDGQHLETLLGQFLVPIVRLAGAQAGLVRALSSDGEHMQLVGELGLPPDVRLAELSVDRHCGTCGIAADNEAMTWSVDLRVCAKHANGGQYFGQHCKRMLAVPLRHRERLLGIYNLFFETDVEISPDILAVLRSIGELLGLALHNARLEREQLFATVMTERKFLASEVHDTIAQTLVYVNMRLPLLRDAMLQHDDQRALKYFSDVEEAVGSVHSTLREILVNFRTAMDPQGLLHALKGIADEFHGRTGISLEYSSDVSDLGLSVEQEVQIFHIVQEALANVCRHSKARHAWLTLRRSGSNLDVLVRDDGLGITNGLTSEQQLHAGDSHFGLGIMKERAQRFGGTVEIGKYSEGGTLMRLSVPVQTSDARQGGA